jgi:hypothetical protein
METVSTGLRPIDGSHVPFFQQTPGEAYGLPDEEEDTLFLVSGLVRMACPNRPDLVSPGEPVRDDKGRVIGCRGLVENKYPQ